MSNRKHITDEDRALFRRAAGGVRRIEDDRIPSARPRRTPAGRDPTARGDNAHEGLVDSEWTPEIAPGDVLSFVRAGVRRREMERLRRGRYGVEANLDLHGRFMADAVPALSRFIEESCRLQRRCVRIVHGKGFGSPGRATHHEGERRPLAACPLGGSRVLLRDPARRRHRRALRVAQALTNGRRPMPDRPPLLTGSRCGSVA